MGGQRARTRACSSTVWSLTKGPSPKYHPQHGLPTNCPLPCWGFLSFQGRKETAMAHSEFDAPWDQESTVCRPIDRATYETVMALPDGAEVVLFVNDHHGMHYDCLQMSQATRQRMQSALDEHNRRAGTIEVTPDNTVCADFALWVHPDDMSPEKRAAIAAVMLERGMQ